jgi:hypothetical protein
MRRSNPTALCVTDNDGATATSADDAQLAHGDRDPGWQRQSTECMAAVLAARPVATQFVGDGP